MIYFVAAFKTGAVQFGPFADEKAAEKMQAWIAENCPDARFSPLWWAR